MGDSLYGDGNYGDGFYSYSQYASFAVAADITITSPAHFGVIKPFDVASDIVISYVPGMKRIQGVAGVGTVLLDAVASYYGIRGLYAAGDIVVSFEPRLAAMVFYAGVGELLIEGVNFMPVYHLKYPAAVGNIVFTGYGDTSGIGPYWPDNPNPRQDWDDTSVSDPWSPSGDVETIWSDTSVSTIWNDEIKPTTPWGGLNG